MKGWDVSGKRAVDVSTLPPSLIPQQYHLVHVRRVGPLLLLLLLCLNS